MNKKIDYVIGVILLAGVILVILGCILTIGTLIGAKQWEFALHEWHEFDGSIFSTLKTTIYFWFYIFVIGIIISLAGNCIALVRIFIKRSVDKKRDYVIGVILLTGVPLVILGYYFFINTLIMNYKLNHILNEWNEVLMRMSSSERATLHFWISAFVIGIYISLAGNCIALVRIVLEKES